MACRLVAIHFPIFLYSALLLSILNLKSSLKTAHIFHGLIWNLITNDFQKRKTKLIEAKWKWMSQIYACDTFFMWNDEIKSNVDVVICLKFNLISWIFFCISNSKIQLINATNLDGKCEFVFTLVVGWLFEIELNYF